MAIPPTEKPETAEIEKAPEFRDELPPDPDEHLNDEERKHIVSIGKRKTPRLPTWLIIIG
jgi:hypothetical protein